MSGRGDPFDDAADSLITAVVPQPCGTTWLLLPGWQQTAAHWTPVARWLTGSGITLLAADLATAAARCTAGRGTLARLRDLVDRLLDEPAAASAAMVVGHSAGVPLAVLLAAALPGVRGVVGVEPVASHFDAAAPRAPVPGVPGGSRGLREQYPMAAEATLRCIDAATRRLPGGGGQAAPGRLPVTDDRRTVWLGEALATTRVPVLVVRGQASALLSAEHAQALAAMAPSGRCTTIANAGHSPHIDSPRATAARLLGFAAELPDHPLTHAGASRE